MQEQLGCRSVIIVSVPSEHLVVVTYLLLFHYHISSCHLVLQWFSCPCFGVPGAQGSHGCRLVIVSLPGEQGSLGHID